MAHNDSVSSSRAGLPRFGLYFPYIHFRDDDWVKVAALYWPKMARIVPAGYPIHDSDTVRALIDNLGWMVDVQPEEVRDLVVPAFEEFITEIQEVRDEVMSILRRDDELFEQGYERSSESFEKIRGNLDWFLDWMPGNWSNNEVEAEVSSAPSWGTGPGTQPWDLLRGYWGSTFERNDGRLAGMYSTEFEPGLRNQLIELQLAHPARLSASGSGINPTLKFTPDQDSVQPWDAWLIMHRDLAWIYKCLLSETVANHNRLTLTTDQVDAHAAASGLSASQLAHGGVAGKVVDEDLTTTFGIMAIQTVVPKDLASVPVDKIIMIRERYGHQFDSWRDYIDRVGSDLAEQLVDVESPKMLHTYLNEAVRKYAEAPVNRLRQDLASVGVDTVSAALNTKFETPAAITATGLVTGHPVVAAAAGAAVGIAELRRSTRGKARAQLASPNSYLLNVNETITPRSWIRRITASMRAAAGLRG
jgi:hypothetical protein